MSHVIKSYCESESILAPCYKYRSAKKDYSNCCELVFYSFLQLGPLLTQTSALGQASLQRKSLQQGHALRQIIKLVLPGGNGESLQI